MRALLTRCVVCVCACVLLRPQIPPAAFFDNAPAALMNSIEPTLSHVVIHPLMTARSLFICDGLLPANGSLTPDCLDPLLNRKKRGGARRFSSLFSTLADSETNQLVALDLLRTLGVKSVVIIHDGADIGVSSFSAYAAPVTASAAEQLNIAVLATIGLVVGICDDVPGVTGSARAANCPPLEYPSQHQTWPDGLDSLGMAGRIAALDPEALIFIGTPGS